MRLLAVSRGVCGGAELAAATFLAHRPAGLHAEALLIPTGPLAETLSQVGVAVADAHGFAARPGVGDLVRFTRAMSGFLRRARPDVVWAVGGKAALLAAPACRLRGVPMVWHKVDFSWDRLLTPPRAAASSGVIAVSQAAAEPLAAWPALRGRLLGIVPPPVRLGADVRAPLDGPPTIGSLGRIIPYKGHHHIVRAAALLSDEFPDLRVVLTGGAEPANYPDYPDRLAALVSQVGLDGRVELTGFVSDVAPVLERLTVYVNATYLDEEGYGLEALSGAMLEAGWAGLPVVAAAGGGTAEGMLDGTTGTLVEAADPELLAAAIAPYLRDRERARRTGEAGMAFARERFSPEVLSGRLYELLGGVAGWR